MSKEQPTTEIPLEIKRAADDLPKGIGFKVRPGPTFLEYKKELRGFLAGMISFAGIFIGIGGIMLLGEEWSGLLFMFGGLIPLFLIKTVYKPRLLLFVIDLAAEKIYAVDKDIEFKSINAIEILVSTEAAVEAHALALNYGENKKKPNRTIIMRTWTTEISSLYQLGEYLEQTLSGFLKRRIAFNHNPMKLHTEEPCLWIIKSRRSISLTWSK